MGPRIILDTSVLIAALRSRRGASYRLLSLVGKDKLELFLSVPLIIEYESVTKRQSRQIGLSHSDIDDVLDYLCHIGFHRKIHYLWRPCLRDPGDDMVLEVAVESESEYVVTHNIRDFEEASNFGVEIVTPQEFLRVIGEIR